MTLNLGEDHLRSGEFVVECTDQYSIDDGKQASNGLESEDPGEHQSFYSYFYIFLRYFY